MGEADEKGNTMGGNLDPNPIRQASEPTGERTGIYYIRREGRQGEQGRRAGRHGTAGSWTSQEDGRTRRVGASGGQGARGMTPLMRTLHIANVNY